MWHVIPHSSAHCRVVMTRKLKAKKSLHSEASGVIFRFFSHAQSPLVSGAKVKKETENSSIHACDYLNKSTVKQILFNERDEIKSIIDSV